jgi:hypothetical protein
MKGKSDKKIPNTQSVPSFAAAALVGAVAGFSGGWVMSRFTRLWNNLCGCRQQPLPYSSQEWDATSKIAEVTMQTLNRRRLTPDELKTAAAIVHYAIACCAGFSYGIALRSRLLSSRWCGAVFGAGLWLAGNECLLPLLGILEREDYNFAMNANALGEHLAYGLTTDLICRQFLSRQSRTSDFL